MIEHDAIHVLAVAVIYSPWHPGFMGWGPRFRRRQQDASFASREIVIDVTSNPEDVVDVTMSIHAAPEHSDRFGAALCMISQPGRLDSTGSVVSIGRRPHQLTRRQFEELLHEAGETGHLSDGFLEIEAYVDLHDGTVVWQPEDGEGVSLPHLDQVVENSIASLVETNVFGDWFSARVVRRAPAKS